MRKYAFMTLITFFFFGSASFSHAGFMDDLLKGIKGSEEKEEDTFISGLKEALDIGTRQAVEKVSVQDGYFGNADIRIPVPGKLEATENLLRKIGMGGHVDDFIISMNRAAEKAAPQALDIFLGAISDMTVTDAYEIIKGEETAATVYFQEKTSDDLTGLFRPVITHSMAGVGVVQSYKRMMDKYNSIPLVNRMEVDLEGYVTEEALNGLFFMVGEEEKKIRNDPSARVTELLQKVFGE
jgi:hypothetical protein